MIRPPRINEAKIALECKVTAIKSLGSNCGSGNLTISKILCMHVHDDILTPDRLMIDPLKFEHIARLGADYYARMSKQNLFKLRKPSRPLPIGFDGLPASIRCSSVLTGNHLGMLANVHEVPQRDEEFKGTHSHERAARLLDLGLIDEAWQTLLHCK